MSAVGAWLLKMFFALVVTSQFLVVIHIQALSSSLTEWWIGAIGSLQCEWKGEIYEIDISIIVFVTNTFGWVSPISFCSTTEKFKSQSRGSIVHRGTRTVSTGLLHLHQQILKVKQSRKINLANVLSQVIIHLIAIWENWDRSIGSRESGMFVLVQIN